MIILDSISFRPHLSAGPNGPKAGTDASDYAAFLDLTRATSGRFAVVTSFQGERYHPETIRALAADSQALRATAGAIADVAASLVANGVVIDLQAMAPADIRALVEVTRAIADSARKKQSGPIAFVVPAADTAAYPGALIARTADLLLVRLDGEHRAGTTPGPFASSPWFTRQLGMRAAEVGASRIVAELPLFGYRWERTGGVRRVTYDEARTTVLGEATSMQRDPGSRALHASSSRDGWEIWINDHETVAFLIDAARRIGVNRFALVGTPTAR